MSRFLLLVKSNMGMLIARGPGRLKRVEDQRYNVDLAPHLNCPAHQDVYI